jgi:two-component system, OmpR family, response regulator
VKRSAPIVIVDDDEAHRELIAHLVGMVSPQSPVTPLGPERVAELADVAPFGALILLDRRLGTQDSLPLIAPLRRARPDLRVALMSAFVTAEDRATCLEGGAPTVFQKPGDVNGWRSILMSLLGSDRGAARAA